MHCKIDAESATELARIALASDNSRRRTFLVCKFVVFVPIGQKNVDFENIVSDFDAEHSVGANPNPVKSMRHVDHNADQLRPAHRSRQGRIGLQVGIVRQPTQLLFLRYAPVSIAVLRDIRAPRKLGTDRGVHAVAQPAWSRRLRLQPICKKIKSI